MEFHIHTNVSNLAVGAMLAQNPTEKCDQLITYASRLLNNVEKNYTTIKRETLTMVYVLHKFRHNLLKNKFFFMWHCYTLSKNLNCQGELQGGCCYS
jgi:hypothetical protein